MSGIFQVGADPYAGDAWLDDLPSSHDNHLAFSPEPCGPEEYETLDREFAERYRGILRGEGTRDTDFDRLAHRLGVLGEITHDRRRPPEASVPVGDILLADLLENEVPDLGPIADDSILGPYADEGPGRALRIAAAAAIAFHTPMEYQVLALRHWERSRPRPPALLRKSIKCVARTPAMIWEPQANGSFVPLLPLARGYLPEGPVHALPALLHKGGHAAVLARVYPLQHQGWVASGAIGLPQIPPLKALQARLDLELLRLRRHERRSTWEDLLRKAPQVLYRFCTTWCWWRNLAE